MENERMRILKMVETGKLSAAEAEKLIAALGGDAETAVARKKDGRGIRFLKIRVYENDSQKSKVNIAVPLGLVKIATKFLPRSARMELNDRQIDLDGILSAIDGETGGRILDVHDAEDNEHVEIVIE